MVVTLIGLINSENYVLISNRKNRSQFSGFWEFPGGKVESDETPIDAACREFMEEVGVDCPKVEEFKIITHSYDDRSVLLNVFYTYHSAEKMPQSERQKTFFINFKKGAQLLEGKMLAANYSIVESFSKYLQSNFLPEAEDSLCLLS